LRSTVVRFFMGRGTFSLNGQLHDSRDIAYQTPRICHISNPIFYVAQRVVADN
jgi:hypothetical protein